MKYLFASILALASLAASASQLPDYPFVHVSGEAFTYGIPDQGSIDFEIVVADVATLEERTNAIRAVLESHDVAMEDAEVGNPRRELGKDGVRTDIKVTVHINVRNLTNWAAIVQGLLEVPNLDGFVTEFDSSQRDKIEAGLVAEAIQDAQKKADAMAAGLKRKLGPATAVTGGQLRNLTSAMGLVPSDFRTRPPGNGSRPRNAKDIVSVNVLKFSKSVDVIYRLK